MVDSEEKWLDVTILTAIPNGIGIEDLTDIFNDVKGVKVSSIELT